MELPEKWSATVIGDFDGSVWFRKSVHIPSGWAKKDIAISLGYIDDVSTLYVNGVCIGHTLRSVRHQKHTIAASAIKAGQKNIFAIRVVDIGGDGGIRGAANEMTLRPLNTENAETISLAGTWKYKISAKLSDLPVMPKGVAEINKSTPTSLYNGMIAPLVPLRFAGVIWYQGESNVQRAQQYRDLFPAMIADWRENFGYGDFPFYFVQIAPYNYGGGHSELLREAQFLTLKNTKNTGMAVTSDIGNLHDIHPKNKQDVGKRLALWALAKDYGEKNIEYSGPIYKSFKIEGDKIRLYFDHAKGLKSSNGGLREFIIAGKEKEFRPATAVLEGDTVVVSSDTIKKPAAVRYGWSNMTKPSLFNGTDLPASSFRTDDDISK
jgi:sialate O-acetylesterase